MVAADGWIDVRWYNAGHLAALKRVHAVCFPGECWKTRDFIRFADRPGQVVKVILNADTGVVLGSLLTRTTPEETQIARLGVLPGQEGVAEAAVWAALLGPHSPNRRSVYTVRVREHDLDAQLFWKGLKFEKTDTEAGCYPHPTEPTWRQDGYWFKYVKPDPVRRRRPARVAAVIVP